jgi:predicted metal-dependent enzyme (double-stranded beta helix superfamily)
MIARPLGRDLDRPELEDLVAGLAARRELWRHLVRHDPGERVYEELVRDNHLAVWLICWMEDHDTGFHDHDRSAGAVAVAQGAVIEDRLHLGRSPSSRRFGAGAAFSFAASDIHRVRHGGAGPAVSIHAYSPPLWRMGAYEVASGGELRRHSISYAEELRPIAV